MMGPAHSLTGLVAGFGVAATVTSVPGAPHGPAATFLFATVTAGCAVLPDIDHPQSTIARSFGPASEVVAHAVATMSKVVQTATGTRKDDPNPGGHRGLTHTLLFAVILGAAVSLLCATTGHGVVIGVLFVSVGLAIRGLMADWAKKQGWVVTTLVSAAAAAAAWFYLPGGDFGWLGLAVAVGCLAHCLGDALTERGCPLFAPIVPISGKRWYDVALPGPMRIRTSGITENWIITPVFLGLAAFLIMRNVPGLVPFLIGS